MSMTIHAEDFRAVRQPSRLSGLSAAWRAVLQRHAARQALVRAGRLGPRLLADMGIEAAAPNGWDNLRPNGYLVHRRR